MNFNRHELVQHLSGHAQVPQTLPATLQATILLFTGQGLFILGESAEKWQQWKASHLEDQVCPFASEGQHHRVFAHLLPTIFIAPHAFLDCVVLNFVSDFQHNWKRKRLLRTFVLKCLKLSCRTLFWVPESWCPQESTDERVHVSKASCKHMCSSGAYWKRAQVTWSAMYFSWNEKLEPHDVIITASSDIFHRNTMTLRGAKESHLVTLHEFPKLTLHTVRGCVAMKVVLWRMAPDYFVPISVASGWAPHVRWPPCFACEFLNDQL